MKTQATTDQMGRLVEVPLFPQRIISLVPSQTELLFDLGVSERIVGCTKFCIHPQPQVKGVAHIGGTKNFHFDRISALKPDLIIGNKEENYKEGIEALAEKYPVWMSDIYTLADALQMIRQMGAIVNAKEKSGELVETIENGFKQLPQVQPPIKVLYLIWRDPIMVAGNSTFIHEVLTWLGLQNVVSSSRYPMLDRAEAKKLQPDRVFLSSEPFPFQEKHLEEMQALWPSAKISLVDGEMFSWYGSRLAKAPSYFKSLLNIH